MTRIYKRLPSFALPLIVCFAIVLRFFLLGSIPNGLYQDETAIGYNAYSILQTQKDEYGKSFPLYFKSFGDQKLPLYVYLTSVSVAFFGLTSFAVRTPSAVAGILTVVALYYLVVQLSRKRSTALIAALLLAINPWSLHFSRAGFEVNVAVFLLVAATLFFTLGIKRKKHLLYLLVSVILFALSVYSYNVTRLLAPAILLLLCVLHQKELRSYSKRIVVLPAGLLLVLLSPFLLTLLSPEGSLAAKNSLLLSKDIEAKGLEMRSYLIGAPQIFVKIFFNTYTQMAWQYFLNIIASLSTSFYYVSGTLHGAQGIGNFGTFYPYEFFTMLIGLVAILQKKIKQYYLFVGWAIVTVLIASLSKEVPHATRSYVLVIPLVVFSAIGLESVAGIIYAQKNRLIKVSALVMAIGLIMYSFIFYTASYYLRFPVVYASNWRQGDGELVSYIKVHEKEYDKVVFDDSAGFIYTSLLFYGSYPPQDFQSQVKRLPDDTEGYSKVVSFGKYEFRKVDWSKDLLDKKTLFITASTNVPDNTPVLRQIKYPVKNVVISQKEVMYQYPYSETAYVIIQSSGK